MSFSGRLSIMDSEPPCGTSTSNSIIPLSIAQRSTMGSSSPPLVTSYTRGNRSSQRKDEPPKTKRRSNSFVCNCGHIVGNIDSSSTIKHLAKELLETRAELNNIQTQIKALRGAQESQLTVLCRQLLDLERGLRKTERNLNIKIQQKDKKIREQANIIEFLGKKTGTKCRDIKDLCKEAEAKIPQIQPVNPIENKSDEEEKSELSDETLANQINKKSADTIIVNVKHEDSTPSATKNQVNKMMSNKQDLTSIYEYSDSQNDNDSDSAIIIDDRLSNSLQRSQYKGISRSISDVVSCISSPAFKEAPASGDEVVIKQEFNSSIARSFEKDEIKNISSIHLEEESGFADIENGPKLPHPPSSCIASLLGSNINTWYSNDACGSLSPPLLLMRKHKSRMTTHLDTRVNSCSSEEEEEEEEDPVLVGGSNNDSNSNDGDNNNDEYQTMNAI